MLAFISVPKFGKRIIKWMDIKATCVFVNDIVYCQLWVPYLHYGLMSYKRNSNEGGIGMECCFISQPGGPGVPQLSKRQPLKYAEQFKTLKSFILGKALLNKVTKWLCYKSLALLAMQKKELGRGNQVRVTNQN